MPHTLRLCGTYEMLFAMAFHCPVSPREWDRCFHQTWKPLVMHVSLDHSWWWPEVRKLRPFLTWEFWSFSTFMIVLAARTIIQTLRWTVTTLCLSVVFFIILGYERLCHFSLCLCVCACVHRLQELSFSSHGSSVIWPLRLAFVFGTLSSECFEVWSPVCAGIKCLMKVLKLAKCNSSSCIRFVETTFLNRTTASGVAAQWTKISFTFNGQSPLVTVAILKGEF